MKTLIIDNYDSYTFNLLQLFDKECQVEVIRNDQFTWDHFTRHVLPHFDNVIISPGPGRPDKISDFGLCTELLKAQLDPTKAEHHRPIFAICLGHQGIGHFMGGKVTYAPRIMHGRMSLIHCQDTEAEYNDVMYQCPSPFWAVRYHSLVVDKASIPSDLLLTAYCYENDADMEALKSAHYVDDTETYDEKNNHFLEHDYQQDKKTDMVTVMGFQHRTLPLWGVQFHPESVSTEHGLKMMANFQQESMAWMTKNNRVVVQPTLLKIPTPMPSIGAPKFKLYVQATIPTWIEPDGLLDELLSTSSVRAAGWLDSSRRASPYSQMSTLSIDPALFLTYSTLHKQLRIQDRTNTVQHQTLPTTFFDYVSDLLVECGEIQIQALNSDSNDLPFKGGLVGYFGYEMKRESMPGYVVPVQQQCLCKHNTDNDHCCLCKEEPDAAFQFVDRFWSFDMTRQQTYLCCLVKTADTYPSILDGVGMSEHEAMNWMENSERLLLEVSEKLRRKRLLEEQLPSADSSACTTPIPTASFSKADLIPDAQHDTYLKSIKKCIDYIKEGESYEICLTTRFRLALSKELSITDDLWRLYTRHLRKNNPAPFSALLMFPQMGLLSSSPERFLKVGTDGVAEMKPIKGTVGRVLQCVCTDECDFGGPLCMENQRVMDEERKQQLWQDVKERAENLMIVDLIRNDLAQVCDPKSVRVPKLMNVESYEKVHHLVSTVRGQLRENVTAVHALQTCFPPGSMTGAPKLRSVQLLDALEQHKPRGVYSGCLGYLSLDGSADFNVVIRTAVASTKENGGVQMSVGGGGAITFLSDPEQEWKETLLKTKSVAPSIKEFLLEQ